MNINHSIVLITGGTGSFGVAFIEKLRTLNPKEIRIFSRDEKKQSDLKRIFPQAFIHWYLGDVRDRESLIDPMHGVDIVFHAAALKQVPTLENFPLEATKTNVIGTDHVLSVAIQQRVKHVVVLSTDKSIQPMSVMGLSKALMEKTVLAKANLYSTPTMNIVRYGNVIASRGSAIPLFVDLMMKNQPITLHQEESTRFLITMDEAIDLVLFAIEQGKHGEIFIPLAKSASLKMIIRGLENVLQKKAVIHQAGLRQGDKLHEQLIEDDEYAYARSTDQGFVIDGLKRHVDVNHLVKPFFSKDVVMSEADLNKLLINTVKKLNQ
jgi:UDP-glucose 4-epimerase